MILIVDKPAGMTSQRVVAQIRHCLPKGTKVGHTGTLDPMCTGVLPILTGADTRLSDYFPKDKEYIAEIRLGIRTDTQDVTGTVLETFAVSCSEEDLHRVSSSFVGLQQQIPPMYSAIRVDGKHLYELARKGIVTEREARTVEIREIEWLGKTAENTYRFRVACSAGTYIRTLCDDMGNSLGCGGAMASLRRTVSNGFSVDRAVSLEQIISAASEGSLERYALTAEQVFCSLDSIIMPPEGLVYFLNGGTISYGRVTGKTNDTLARAYAPDGAFVALAEKTPNGWKASLIRCAPRPWRPCAPMARTPPGGCILWSIPSPTRPGPPSAWPCRRRARGSLWRPCPPSRPCASFTTGPMRSCPPWAAACWTTPTPGG